MPTSGGRLGERLEVGGELGPLFLDERVWLGVNLVEHVERLGGGERAGLVTHAYGDPLALLLQGGHEIGVENSLRFQMASQAVDRVPATPDLELVGDAVARRVVRGRVRPHAVGEGLDEERAVAFAGVPERRAG